MRFMAIWKPANIEGMENGTPPSQEEMDRMGAFIEEVAKAGVLITTDGLLGTEHGAKVIRKDGVTTVVDGPFTEAKEIVGGYAIFNVNSLTEMIDWTKRFVEVAGDGESEIRQMYDEPAFDANRPTS